MMKYILITLLLFFASHLVRGQEIHIDSIRYALSASVSKYVYHLSITNKDSVDLLTWIVDDNEMFLSKKKKIQRHFFANHGDFNLFTLLTDVDNYTAQEELFFPFFLKRIRPNGNFLYIIICNKSISRDFLLNKILTIKEKCLKSIISIPIFSKNLYPYDCCLYLYGI